jgi:hypothetical protein
MTAIRAYRRRQPTPEQRAATEARRERFRALAKRISEMSETERADLAARMGSVVTIEGRVLSVHNTCLIAAQNPVATVVGGFAQWLKHGRAVKKGQHGLMIWVPIAARKGDEPAPEPAGDAESNDGPRFIMGTVFDVSQTEERTEREQLQDIADQEGAPLGYRATAACAASGQ